MKNKIIHGDCREEMKKLESNSIDAIVTDPPAGISFMGKEWDNKGSLISFQDFICESFTEAIRVLKPGGHCIVWAIPRTSHHTAMGLERAGFEVRDVLIHLFGSGFPKSHNIGKKIDEIQGNERELIEVKHKANISVPGSNEGWKRPSHYNDDGSPKTRLEITKGNSEWEGWGTNLKPASEHWVLCRKPLSEKNVALNVLKHGTGGINIDACRIGSEIHKVNVNDFSNIHSNKYGSGAKIKTLSYREQQGRFPSNVILSEEAGKMLDEQSGISNGEIGRVGRKSAGEYDNTSFKVGVVTKTGIKDKGGASRFFYCAKPSRAERNIGLEYSKIPEKLIPINEPHNSKDLEERYKMTSKNFHPTCKSIALMQYLIKLVTREGALVLDPFGGSGTTMIACLKLNRKCILIEKELEYIEIAKARIKPFMDQKVLK